MTTTDTYSRVWGLGPARSWLVAVASSLVFPLLDAAPGGAVAQEGIPGFTPENARTEARYEEQYLRGTEPDRIREHHEYMAQSPAEEGTPGAWRRVRYIKRQLESYGLEADIQTFYPYMVDSREVRVSVEMVSPRRLSLPVKEERQPWHQDYDEISVGFNEGTPSSDVTAEAVYANYGRAEDYDVLEERGVEVEGKIVLVRYGATQRSEKPYQAYVHGAAGLIMYSDPADDGFVHGPVYPDGPWQPPDGIERGTIYRWTLYAGDPLTPGWAATKNAPRIPVEESNVSEIPPTTPIGYGAARPLLENLTGPEAPEGWQGGLPFTYRLGGPGSTVIHLKIDAEYAPRAAWNVIARIPGTEHADEMVVSGVHPDAWAYGASDHTSGVTSHLEMARGLGKLLEAGWRPKRTLVLGFFGAEERGLTGSTEFTELLGEGMSRVVAYVNTGNTDGENFSATGMPALDDLMFDVARRVEWPGTGGTLYEDWLEKTGSSGTEEPRVARPRGGSDYLSFYAQFGAPVLMPGAGVPGGRYHCICDDFHTIENFTDPGMRYQAAVAQVIGLLALRLSGADVLPFQYSRYATEVVTYLEEFDETQRAEFGSSVVDLDRDVEQARAWAAAARRFEEVTGRRVAEGADPSTLRALNRALMRVERALLARRGLPGRPWYKHQIYAAQFYNGFATRLLPGLYDALYVQEDEAEARAYEAQLYESLVEATEILEDAARRSSQVVS